MNPRDLPVCGYCDEPIRDGDAISPSMLNGRAVHMECGMRMVLGGSNHIRKLCTCYGGEREPDPPGLTKREAAQAAMDAWNLSNPMLDQ